MLTTAGADCFTTGAKESFICSALCGTSARAAKGRDNKRRSRNRRMHKDIVSPERFVQWQHATCTCQTAKNRAEWRNMAHHNTSGITIQDKPAEWQGMRVAGKLAAETLDFIMPHVVPGVSTGVLNDLCHDFIVQAGAIPAPLNYKGFPKSICTSVND